MKKILQISAALIILTVLAINAQITDTQTFNLQELTGGKEFKRQQREKWENEINAIEEGISWKVLNQESFYSKYLSKKKTKFDAFQSEFVADGKIEGTWRELGSNNQAGRMHYVDVDFENEIIYAASSGGHIWKGNLKGENWTCLNNSIEFSNPQFVKYFDVNGKRRVIAAAYGSSTIWYTDNDGVEWKQADGIESLSGWTYFKRAVVANNQKQTVYVLRNQSSKTLLYKSNDYGSSFTKIQEFPLTASQVDLWAPRYDSDNVYILVKNTLYKILPTDEVELISELPDAAFQESNPDKIRNIYLKGGVYEGNTDFMVLIHNSSGNYSNLYSKNSGKSWTISTTKQANGLFMVNSFETSSYTSDFVFFGSVELHKSLDGSSSWNKISNWWDYYPTPKSVLHADICGVQFFRHPDSGDEIMYISTDGGLYESYDYAESVNNLSLKGLRVGQYYDVYTAEENRNYIHLGAQDQGYQLCKTDSGGVLEFDQIISGDYGQIVSSDGGSTVWTVYPNFLMAWINVFSNSILQRRWDFEGVNWQWMTSTAADIKDPRTVYLVGGNGTTQIGSNVWKASINSQFEVEASIISPDFYKDNGIRLNVVYASQNGKIYCGAAQGQFLIFNGQSWQIVQVQPDENKARYTICNDLVEDSKNNVIYYASSGYSTDGFYYSKDGGYTWTASTNNLPKTSISEIAVSDDGEYVFAATRVGPYIYIVDEEQWYSLSGANTPETDYRSVEFIPETKTARFATYGRGAWDFTISKIMSVESDTKSNIFTLSNYPNPATSSNSLIINNDIVSNFVINIYNSQGIKVHSLFEGFLPTGNHEFNWLLSDDAGNALPNGMYYYTVSSNGITKYQKVIVSK